MVGLCSVAGTNGWRKGGEEIEGVEEKLKMNFGLEVRLDSRRRTARNRSVGIEEMAGEMD